MTAGNCNQTLEVVNELLQNLNLEPNEQQTEEFSEEQLLLYSSIEEYKVRKNLAYNYVHCPELWIKTFNDIRSQISENKQSNNNYTKKFRGLRMLIINQTTRDLQRGYYYYSGEQKNEENIEREISLIADKQRSNYHKIANSTIYYTSKMISDLENRNTAKNCSTNENKNENENNENNVTIEILKNVSENNVNNKRFTTDIFTINMDCLDCSYSFLIQGWNPILLNMANQFKAGGGYKSGAGAQEENMFRRTLYQLSLEKKMYAKYHSKSEWQYPMEEFGCIYSPNITVFRSNEQLGYRYLQHTFSMTFIAAAMYRKCEYDEETLLLMDATIVENIKLKIVNILRVCKYHMHDCLVLGAWGCGAFKTPPLHMAKLFHEVIVGNEEFDGVFRIVCFPILDDHNSGRKHNPRGNYAPFAEIFGERTQL